MNYFSVLFNNGRWISMKINYAIFKTSVPYYFLKQPSSRDAFTLSKHNKNVDVFFQSNFTYSISKRSQQGHKIVRDVHILQVKMWSLKLRARSYILRNKWSSIRRVSFSNFLSCWNIKNTLIVKLSGQKFSKL